MPETYAKAGVCRDKLYGSMAEKISKELSVEISMEKLSMLLSFDEFSMRELLEIQTCLTAAMRNIS